MVRDVGARIRHARLRRGLTVDGLAALAGLAERELVAIEDGTRRASGDTLLALAQLLGVRIASFFGSVTAADMAAAPRPPAAAPTPPMRDMALMTEAFARIDDPAMRQTVLDVMHAVAAAKRPGGQLRGA